ncbi:winged helix-turn-helix domain-containing protein [Streptomyces sp. NPDC006602]|uniref:helix-turn-helix domain-containing protein n=1 Tax=Streptomyces sp. NPDC006602 TaxID=3364751 RepID=UPI0036D0E5DE
MAAVWRLLHRHGWSWQSPARRPVERDEHAVELWEKDVWPPPASTAIWPRRACTWAAPTRHCST